MAVKDLSAFLAPDLDLPWGDRVFSVPPPSKDVGLKLAAVHAGGVAAYLAYADACPSCGRAGAPDSLPEETKALLDSIKDTDLGVLSLGPAYQQMIDAGVPGADIDMFALYALYYWVLGEASADAILAAQHGDGGASGEAAPGSSTPPPGPPTGSGSRTRKASTRGTGASRKN